MTRDASRRSTMGTLAAVILLVVILTVLPSDAQAPLPAGSTNALLSFIDAAGGHISIRRHWHGAGGEEVQVFPWTPYWWDGCLPFQSGALMLLVTSPVGYPAPGLTSAESYTTQYLARLGQTISGSVSVSAAQLPPDQSEARQSLAKIAAGLLTPGDPAYEALKSALGQINSLPAYEDYGYATFLLIRWKWVWTLFGPIPVPCADYRYVTIPEGYSIPIVSRKQQQQLRQQHPGFMSSVLAGRIP